MAHPTPPFRASSHPRRSLLKLAVAGPALWLASAARLARAEQEAPVAAPPRLLSLVNTHTGESLQVRYFDDGQYVAASLSALQHLLRDHRSGESHPMDPGLFDVLYALAQCAECEPHFEIISGYRSPASNAALHVKSKGVASSSLHMEGRAIDVRLSGAPCTRLRDLALAMQCGGVGYYAKSDFVHLDTGRTRFWAG
jgi:uncharacterized protein YcbK (DUF882 family)